MKKITLVLFSILFVANATSQITNGLIAKYYFNNANANDDGGKYHGVVNGAVLTMDRFGNSNKAYQFGTNHSIIVSDHDSLDGMTNEFSISFWVKSTQVNNYQNFLISKFSHCGGSIDAFNIGLHSNNSILSQFNDASGLDAYQIGNKTITDNKWHHVAVIWKRPNVITYIDTVLESFSQYDLFNSTISNSPEVLAFGHPKTVLCSSYVFDYNEILDDIRLYKRALTRKEVDTLFNEPNPVKPINSVLSLDNDISVSPNPSCGYIYIAGLQNPTEIELFSIEGRKLKSFISKDLIHIDDIKSGTYLLKINDKTFKILLDD